jgi:hypothetical protein
LSTESTSDTPEVECPVLQISRHRTGRFSRADIDILADVDRTSLRQVLAFHDRDGDLATRASNLRSVFTLGPVSYGIDLLAAVEDGGTASPLCFAGPDDIATLNCTGGTTELPMTGVGKVGQEDAEGRVLGRARADGRVGSLYRVPDAVQPASRCSAEQDQ